MTKTFLKLNHRQWRMAALISCCITLMMLTTGCSPTWVSEAQSIVTTLTTIIGSIGSILSLFGVAITPSVKTAITDVTTDVTNELAEVGPLITAYESQPSSTTWGSVTNALNTIKANLTNLLSGIGQLSAAMQTKIGAIITLAINAWDEIISLIPAPTATAAELHEHRARARVFFLSSPSKKLKTAYNTILDTPTGDAEADAVFAKVPRL